MKYFSLDFETTTDPNDCRVWMWGLYDIYDEEFVWGKDIADLLKYISRVPCKCYFHNLGFDSEFLMTYLFRNGYEHIEKGRVEKKQFKTLITDMQQIYSMRIGFGQRAVTIYDSLKIIPLKVSAIPKAFGLEEAKGEIDYNKFRPVGYDPDENEISYMYHDVSIVGKALRTLFDSGLDHMTQASNALWDFKSGMTKYDFKDFFPFDFFTDAFCRQSYKGGFVYLNPKFANQILGDGLVFDFNSLYPAVMYESLLPIGRPHPFIGQYQLNPSFPLYIQELSCSFKLKPNHIPTIMIKQSRLFKDNQYIESSEGQITTLILTNVDLKLFFDHYDVQDLTYKGGYMFLGKRDIFKPYIDKWFAVKEKATIEKNAGQRQIAKLMLNSLYGKFGSNPSKANKIPYYDEEEQRLKYRTTPKHLEKGLYVPMASFITAYARNKTIRAAQSVYDRFIYADTDSLHLVGTEIPENLDIDDTRLGALDNELIFSKAKFLHSKCYIEYGHDPKKLNEPDKLKVTIAGLPDSAKDEINFGTFNYGFSTDKKLRTTRVAGGIVLTNTLFTIKEPKE